MEYTIKEINISEIPNCPWALMGSEEYVQDPPVVMPNRLKGSAPNTFKLKIYPYLPELEEATRKDLRRPIKCVSLGPIGN